MALAVAQVVDNIGNVSVVIFTNQTAAGNGGWFDISALRSWSVHITDITTNDIVIVSVSSAASIPGDSDDEITHTTLTADGIATEPDNTFHWIKVHKSDGTGSGNTDANFYGIRRRS